MNRRQRPVPGRDWAYRREDYFMPRMRPAHERSLGGMLVRSAPPLRSWGSKAVAVGLIAAFVALLVWS